MKLTVFLTACGIALPLMGCNPETQGPSQAEIPQPGPAVSPVTEPAPSGQKETPAASDVTLEALDWEATRALVDQHRGQVVVMDLWATYCPPCVAEFPHLVALQRMHPDKVACVSVSADYMGQDDTPEAHREKVMKFLVKQGATFTNVLLTTDADTLFNSKIEGGSLPVVYVFDQQGQLAARFPDLENPEEFTYQESVYPLVEKLLKNQ